MINYTKPLNLITLLKDKHEFLIAYSRELYKAKRYGYPIVSLNIILPEKISEKKMKQFIIDSFRESDIVYYNCPSRYIQVLLPYTPQDNLYIIIDRITKIYDLFKSNTLKNQLKCEIVKLTKESDNDISKILCVFDKSEALVYKNYKVETLFNTISKKIMKILEVENTEINFINNYAGLKVNYKATLVGKVNGAYTFETDPMQLAAIKNSSETLIEIKKYGFHISAIVENVDFVLNRVTLSSLNVMDYNTIYPSSLTVELKESLSAELISLGSNAKIELSAVSFNEIHGYGNISNLAIDNNTLRLQIFKNEQIHTVLVRFVYSKFNGTTQNFILKIIDNSEKSLELFQNIVTKRSRECIQELKKSIA